MELFHSVLLFLQGILRRFYYWVPPLLFDPFEIYDRIIKPNVPEGWRVNITFPSDWAFGALILLLVWAAILTFHEARPKTKDLRSNMPIKKALSYICEESSWAYENFLKDSLLYATAAELRQRAIEERVQIWGRPEIKGTHQRPEFSSAELPIKKEHWYKFELNLRQIYEPELFGAQTQPEDSNDPSTREAIRYNQLRVDVRQIRNEWRRATIMQRVCYWVAQEVKKIRRWLTANT